MGSRYRVAQWAGGGVGGTVSNAATASVDVGLSRQTAVRPGGTGGVVLAGVRKQTAVPQPCCVTNARRSISLTAMQGGAKGLCMGLLSVRGCDAAAENQTQRGRFEPEISTLHPTHMEKLRPCDHQPPWLPPAAPVTRLTCVLA